MRADSSSGGWYDVKVSASEGGGERRERMTERAGSVSQPMYMPREKKMVAVNKERRMRTGRERFGVGSGGAVVGKCGCAAVDCRRRAEARSLEVVFDLYRAAERCCSKARLLSRRRCSCRCRWCAEDIVQDSTPRENRFLAQLSDSGNSEDVNMNCRSKMPLTLGSMSDVLGRCALAFLAEPDL